MMATQVVAVQMNDRCNHAPQLQEVLTRHGCVIKVRLGVPDMCEGKGLILLVVEGDDNVRGDLLSELRGVPDTTVSSIDLPAQ
ncbi:MAG: hypothetical protein ACM3X4_03465 [Ignavibacteriales bacterium]